MRSSEQRGECVAWTGRHSTPASCLSLILTLSLTLALGPPKQQDVSDNSTRLLGPFVLLR